MSDESAAPASHEEATEANVAEEEAERDDAGRGIDESGGAGWRLQAKVFGGVGLFIALIATVYWFVSYEPAGTVFLSLASAMALMIAVYVGYPRARLPALDDAHEAPEPGHDPHDGVWFPEASIWPFAIGAGMVLVGNGLLLGLWFLLPAAAFLLWAVAGMIRQGRDRI